MCVQKLVKPLQQFVKPSRAARWVWGGAGPPARFGFAGDACSWQKLNGYTCILGFGPEESGPVEEPSCALRPVSVVGGTVEGQHVTLGGPRRPPPPVLQAGGIC